MVDQITKKYILTIFILLLALGEVFTQVVVRRAPARGRTVVRIDNGARVVHRGATFHYVRGVFYRPVRGRGYVVVAPPIGARVRVLPPVYTRVVFAGAVLFYYNGVYYRALNNSEEYEVVDPPVGARVNTLPDGVEIRVVNGDKLYVVDNTYYKEVIVGGNLFYEVVDINDIAPTEVVIGTRLPSLPENAEQRIIDDQIFYVVEGIYYKEIIDDNEIWYEIVGRN